MERALREELEAGLVGLTRAGSCLEAVARLEGDGFDVCLFDLALGEASLLQLLHSAAAWGRRTPVVLLASPADETLAVLGLEHGARDCLFKGSLDADVLFRALWYAARIQTAEDAAHHLADRYRSLFEHNLAASFRLSLDGRLLDCNPAFLRIFGYGAKDEALAPGAVALDFPSWGRGGTDWFLELARSRWKEVAARRHDGGEIQILMRGALALDAGGRPEAIEGTLLDLTELRQVQEELHRREAELHAARRLAALGRMVGGVAHDFGNILTVVQGYSDLLLRDLEPGDPRRRMLEEVRAAAQRAGALTGQLLALTDRRSVAGRSAEINRVVRDLRGMLDLLLGAGLHLDLDLDPEAGAAALDAGELEQVVTNLVLNGRDAMPDGGSLHLATAPAVVEDCDDTRPGGLAPGPYVLLTIRDQGVGMDPITVDRIFEPFFTTKQSAGGRGLGLSTVQDIVSRAAGAIQVASQPARGTTVRVWLPRAGEDEAAALTTAP